MKLISVSKYTDFTREDAFFEELGERFEDVMKDVIEELGDVNQWADDYPGLSSFYFWFQSLFDRRWRSRMSEYPKIVDDAEDEMEDLNIHFGDQFYNQLNWMKDRAESDEN